MHSPFVQVPVTRMGLCESVAERVLELISRDQLRPGDRLPPLKELAMRFGVATPTMREALRRLEATGVIDIRHGSGIYVRNGYQRMMIANPSFGKLEARTILDLLDARLLIEPELAELTTKTADDVTIARIGSILDEAEKYLTGNDRMLHKVNMSFHLAIAQCSGNIVLAHIMESLIDLYSHEQLVILALYNARTQDHQEHRAIFDAIRSRDPQRARVSMEQHLKGVKAIVAARLAEGVNASS